MRKITFSNEEIRVLAGALKNPEGVTDAECMEWLGRHRRGPGVDRGMEAYKELWAKVVKAYASLTRGKK